MPAETRLPDDDAVVRPMRCAIVVDRDLPSGRAANAAAVLALTLGARHPGLPGAPLLDGSGQQHPGLIPIGIAVLGAPGDALPGLRESALARDLDLVDFPVQGQETTDYDAFGAMLRAVPADRLSYLGLALYGPRNAVAKVVGRLPLLS
ncbi:DUF2000 domain-containing protein [Marinibaculum pumilum]|uniref:DUF2000 domain-containing protein n=1 Tax=Marinibaculum pumilum TaxID=1766165 RepID=A0ABV7KYJ7_9PROT